MIHLTETAQFTTGIEGLRRRFREVKTGRGQNTGYNTHGVIVPLGFAENHLARKVIAL
jgi:hypothetical protein